MSSSNPTGSGGRIPIARLLLVIAVFAGLIAIIANFVDEGQVSQTERTYPEIAQASNLQTELERLPEEASWREHASLPENTQPETPAWLAFLPWGAIGQMLFWGIIVLVIIGLLALLIILVRTVGTGRFARDEIRQSRKPVNEPLPTVQVRETQPLTISQILEMTDLEAAIGELQRSALAAAAFITGITLKRSATAREALRKLPSDWRYRPNLAELVRESEQVRFAGHAIDRDRLEILVESVRPMLKQAGGAR